MGLEKPSAFNEARILEIKKSLNCLAKTWLASDENVNTENQNFFNHTIKRIEETEVLSSGNELRGIEKYWFGANVAIHDLIRKNVVYGRNYVVTREHMLNKPLSLPALYDMSEGDVNVKLFDVVLVLPLSSEFTGDFGVYMGYDEESKKHIIIRDNITQ